MADPSTKGTPGPGTKLHGGNYEGHLATLLYRACLDAGHPITVPASRHAAAAALAVLDPPPPMTGWPPLMVELHESVRWAAWSNLGLLAAALRRHADRLDAVATAACMAAAVAGAAGADEEVDAA